MTLPPLDGVRVLLTEPEGADGDQQIYEMPIITPSAKATKATAKLTDQESIYQYVVDHSDRLSLRDQIALLQKAILIEPSSPACWHALACCYERQGKDWFAATNAWNHVIYLQPNNAVAWYSLAQLWAARGMQAKALECYAQYEALEGKQKRSQGRIRRKKK